MGATDIEETILSVSADVEETKGALPSGRVDAALEFLQAQETVDMSAIDEKKLVQKIDWMIIPLLWACYMLQYLDKVLSMKKLHCFRGSHCLELTRRQSTTGLSWVYSPIPTWTRINSLRWRWRFTLPISHLNFLPAI